MTKTIIFDLGGVYFSDGTKNAIKVISEKYKIAPENVQSVLKGELGTKYRVGEITVDEFWDGAKKIWNMDAPNEDLSAIWLEGYKPIEGMEELVKNLKESGHQLLFLSDNVAERVKYLEEKFHFMENFEDGVFSHIAKIRKPNLEIYKLALEKARGEVRIYIDDKPELLEPAKELGMETVAFNSAEQLEAELKKLGVEFKEIEKAIDYKIA